MVISSDANPITAKPDARQRVVLDHLPGPQPYFFAAGVGVVLHLLLTEIGRRKLKITDYRLPTDPANAIREQPDQYQNQNPADHHSTRKFLKPNIAFAGAGGQMSQRIYQHGEEEQLAERRENTAARV